MEDETKTMPVSARAPEGGLRPRRSPWAPLALFTAEVLLCVVMWKLAFSGGGSHELGGVVALLLLMAAALLFGFLLTVIGILARPGTALRMLALAAHVTLMVLGVLVVLP